MHNYTVAIARSLVTRANRHIIRALRYRISLPRNAERISERRNITEVAELSYCHLAVTELKRHARQLTVFVLRNEYNVYRIFTAEDRDKRIIRRIAGNFELMTQLYFFNAAAVFTRHVSDNLRQLLCAQIFSGVIII